MDLGDSYLRVIRTNSHLKAIIEEFVYNIQRTLYQIEQHDEMTTKNTLIFFFLRRRNLERLMKIG